MVDGLVRAEPAAGKLRAQQGAPGGDQEW